MSPDKVHLSRLRWRCRRGMLELDLLLAPFIEHEYLQLDESQRNAFERLLRLPDPELYSYLMEENGSGEREFDELITRIRAAATL